LTAFAANGHLAYYAALFISLHFPCWRYRTHSRQPCFHTASQTHTKLQEFSPGRWTALSSTRTANYNQTTRCHSPEYGNFPTPCLCCMDD